jgi:hypothetical protein
LANCQLRPLFIASFVANAWIQVYLVASFLAAQPCSPALGSCAASHAERKITPGPVRDRAKPQLLASTPWIEKETAVDLSHIVSSNEKILSQQLA